MRRRKKDVVRIAPAALLKPFRFRVTLHNIEKKRNL
jgi:hypothetical protein